ncbi:MAG: hypothetical protein IJZ82_07505 [Lachnospiraceae bacterium]|nr:hypothetical protein [Lachnospiraceae bacterium]
MNVNGITNQAVSAYQTYSKVDTKAKEEAAVEEKVEGKATENASDKGVVLEVSKEAKKTYTQNTALVNQLKQDAENRMATFKKMIADMMSKQAGTFGTATDDAMWKFLASGDFTVDAATKAQAQADIAEDGYWGVEQTSDRIIDFAVALTGGDPDKVEEMREAFKKGYAQAEETWGGKLPEISQKTYDAVMKKFDELAGVEEAAEAEE